MTGVKAPPVAATAAMDSTAMPTIAAIRQPPPPRGTTCTARKPCRAWAAARPPAAVDRARRRSAPPRARAKPGSGMATPTISATVSPAGTAISLRMVENGRGCAATLTGAVSTGIARCSDIAPIPGDPLAKVAVIRPQQPGGAGGLGVQQPARIDEHAHVQRRVRPARPGADHAQHLGDVEGLRRPVHRLPAPGGPGRVDAAADALAVGLVGSSRSRRPAGSPSAARHRPAAPAPSSRSPRDPARGRGRGCRRRRRPRTAAESSGQSPSPRALRPGGQCTLARKEGRGTARPPDGPPPRRSAPRQERARVARSRLKPPARNIGQREVHRAAGEGLRAEHHHGHSPANRPSKVS